jgi:ArsR family transcriptional regulator, nickel/cobalt-responsive transcriptional repressor
MHDPLRSAECSKFLKALGDPDRLKIVQCLRDGPKAVGEISRELDAPLANVSHHVRLLREAGVVRNGKRGRFVIYSLDPEVLRREPRTVLDVLDFGCCRVELGRRP